MPIRREFAPSAIEPEDLKAGRVEPHYIKVLTRLLAAHALAEKLTALGYERALRSIESAELRTTIEKNLIEERNHAAMVYRALGDLGISESVADRSMIGLSKSPSFEAPRMFSERATNELELLMGSLSVDMTGLIMIGVNYQESSYGPHARAAELIVEEEADHDQFASEQLSETVQRLGHEVVNGALREWLPRAANFFGPPGSGFTYDCIRYGLKERDNQELAELYLARLGARLAQLGLEMPRFTTDYPRALA